MTTPSPGDLLKPDERMSRVLDGRLGFAPPAFAGEAGIALSGSTRVLVLRSQQTVVVACGAPADSGSRIAAVLGLPESAVRVGTRYTDADIESIARAAVESIRPARVEWTDALVPAGGASGWSAMTTIWIARVVDADGLVLATLLVTGSPASDESASAIVSATTGSPVLVLAGDGGDSEADARGRALGHAALAALAELPPPAMELHLDRVVESGAPLAVWRPRAAAEAGEPGIRVGDGTWQVGPALLRFDESGAPIDATLPPGAYAR